MLTGPQRKHIVSTLLEVFPHEHDLEQMVSFELGENLSVIAGGKNYGAIAFQLVQWAESRGKLNILITAARDSNPENAALATLFETYGKPDTLEDIVIPSIPFADIEPWTECFKACARAVCRIERPMGIARGTGFLLGPNLLITNCHVLRPVFSDPGQRDTIGLHFDYRVDAYGNLLDQRITYIPSSDKNWIVAYSSENALDYAIMRIKIIDAVFDQNRPWLTPQHYTFTPGEAISVVQHPLGMPLQIASGSIVKVQATPTRVIYNTNTRQGSSGSPCLASNGALVALHCSGTPTRNEGIPFTAILEDLRAKNLAHLVDDELL